MGITELGVPAPVTGGSFVWDEGKKSSEVGRREVWWGGVAGENGSPLVVSRELRLAMWV